MALKINKPGITTKDASYNGLYIILRPLIELHYDRVSIYTTCYDIEDTEFSNPIVPENWEGLNPIKVPFEDDASNNIGAWSHQRTLDIISSEKSIPYEYMRYEDDVFELDTSSGEPLIDPSLGKPITKHKKGEFIKKKNGTAMFYTKKIDRFCEAEDVSILSTDVSIFQ